VTQRFDGLNLYENFSQVLDVVPYEKGTTKKIIIEARRISPTAFDIISSSNDPGDLGQSAEFHLFIFGNTKGKHNHVWKELLGGAISLFNKNAFNSSIIQSCAALDAFMGHFLKEKVIGKVVDEKKWSNKKVENEYFIPKRKNFISNTEIYCQIFQDILHIKLTNTECHKSYFGSNGKGYGIKTLRDKLAHGDIEKFTEILTKKNLTEEEAAQWALQSIIRMIYHIRFFKPNPLH
jgi:hypothetical protein